MFGQGFTYPSRISRGLGFAETTLGFRSSYWWRWSFTRKNWVFSVARDLARRQRPFIVGYFSDWHYAIGYGVAECQTHGWERHSWVYIYPAWRTNNTQDKWIPKSTIFGIWGVYNFYR